ncbi:hypothetical protein MTP99_005090 [Tenebrio molitor]|nr:hypothetical protein MTP99_005090 [Tenebrio molitor]
MQNCRLLLESSRCGRNDLENYYCKGCNFETDLVQTRSNGIAVISANTKRNIRGTLNNIRQFIPQQTRSNADAETKSRYNQTQR